MQKKLIALSTATLLIPFLWGGGAVAEEYLNGIEWVPPAIITPGKTNADPPSDAIILFDGTDLSKWKNGENWSVKDGDRLFGQRQDRQQGFFRRLPGAHRMAGTTSCQGKRPRAR